MPGFVAEAGCEVHIYNDGCTNTYSRMAMPIDSSNITLIHEQEALAIINAQNIKSNLPDTDNTQTHSTLDSTADAKNFTGQNSAGHHFIRVIPNPSTAIFKIEFGGSDSMPQKFSVIDGFGKIIREVYSPSGNIFVLDLNEYSDGIYALRIDYPEKVVTKMLVKSANN